MYSYITYQQIICVSIILYQRITKKLTGFSTPKTCLVECAIKWAAVLSSSVKESDICAIMWFDTWSMTFSLYKIMLLLLSLLLSLATITATITVTGIVTVTDYCYCYHHCYRYCYCHWLLLLLSSLLLLQLLSMLLLKQNFITERQNDCQRMHLNHFKKIYNLISNLNKQDSKVSAPHISPSRCSH